jgi:hypothetical protein
MVPLWRQCARGRPRTTALIRSQLPWSNGCSLPLHPPTPLVALLAKIGASLEAIPCPRIETELSKDALSSELSSGDQPATELEMEQMDASSRGGLVKVAASQPNQQTQPKRRSSALPWSILQASWFLGQRHRRARWQCSIVEFRCKLVPLLWRNSSIVEASWMAVAPICEEKCHLAHLLLVCLVPG